MYESLCKEVKRGNSVDCRYPRRVSSRQYHSVAAQALRGPPTTVLNVLVAVYDEPRPGLSNAQCTHFQIMLEWV